ncbi:hypothetical protein BD408DRAFT_428983 [Parasitella parasitica]|nr:hypothetical protein BD408DRAFT_428983 [Parasitella parasitica]
MSSSTTKQTFTLGKNPKASGTKSLDPHRSWSYVAAGKILSCHNSQQTVANGSKPTSSKPKSGLAPRSSTQDSKNPTVP